VVRCCNDIEMLVVRCNDVEMLVVRCCNGDTERLSLLG
jgi:hypothetical protein